jgi:hypothetical protein
LPDLDLCAPAKLVRPYGKASSICQASRKKSVDVAKMARGSQRPTNIIALQTGGLLGDGALAYGIDEITLA